MAHGKRKKAAQKSLNIVSIDPERRAELEASVQERLCAMRAAAPCRAAKPAPRGGGARRPAVPQEAAPAPPPPPPASDGGAEDAMCLVAFAAPAPANAKTPPQLPAAEAAQLQRAPSSASVASEALPLAPPPEHEAASELGDSPFTEEEETTDDGAWSSSCFTDDAFANDAPPPADEPPAGAAELARLGAEEGGAPAEPLAAPLECDFTAGNMLTIAAAVPLLPDDGAWDADADAPPEADSPDDDWAPADDPSWQKSPVPQPAAAADAARAEQAFADGAAAAAAADEALAALARLQAAGAAAAPAGEVDAAARALEAALAAVAAAAETVEGCLTDLAPSDDSPQPQPLPAAGADGPSRRGSRSGEADGGDDTAAADRPDAPSPLAGAAAEAAPLGGGDGGAAGRPVFVILPEKLAMWSARRDAAAAAAAAASATAIEDAPLDAGGEPALISSRDVASPEPGPRKLAATASSAADIAAAPKPAGPPSRERDSGPDASEAGDAGCEAAVRPPIARSDSKAARRVKRFWSKFVSAFGGGCCRAPAVRV
ncbi:hypothetical protein Rsub_05780 [Raphidocelis subcapitata]|uniref:Uncharacterized protein n=1 Tax=Raphidocelis subcapitata TaxID=307507 RepID=A0A2V0NZ88_9CHLO|nr:hypothetical protein Rsub_05780 [Raphidocelis subcapitata]|eukprot:GBF92944.1 hypothetical protein Rsub_05780 [Raphidocelis subcapitata]